MVQTSLGSLDEMRVDKIGSLARPESLLEMQAKLDAGDIAERLFNGLNHKRFMLEYESQRAGSFEPLRFVPSDKIVVLGLVTTKSTDIEAIDDPRCRIDEAAHGASLLGKEREFATRCNC